MNNFDKIIIDTLKMQNYDFSEDVMSKFCQYAYLLVNWNEKLNLTSITNPEEIAIKHFEDSISVFKYIKIPQNAKVIDIGTGAGFPGIPLKILRPDINLTLLDSLNKRLVFLQNVLTTLNLKANLVHSRAEEFGKKEIYREQFDFVFSRAVAKLNVLSELCLPCVKKNGFFISLKGKNIECEVSEALGAIKKLGGNLEKINKFKLINENERSLVQIRKVGLTPSIYPRQSVKISKNPL